jgi:hypothetical protein
MVSWSGGHLTEHAQQSVVHMTVVALVTVVAKYTVAVKADQGNGH